MAELERSVLAEEQAALRRRGNAGRSGRARGSCRSRRAGSSRRPRRSSVALSQHRPDGALVVVASVNSPAFPVGSRWPLDAPSVAARSSSRAGGTHRYSNLPGEVVAAARNSPIEAAIGVPIIVDGKVWGDISVAVRTAKALPADTEERLHSFTGLLAAAISTPNPGTRSASRRRPSGAPPRRDARRRRRIRRRGLRRRRQRGGGSARPEGLGSRPFRPGPKNHGARLGQQRSELSRR